MRKTKFEDPTPVAAYFCDPMYPERTVRETAKHFSMGKSTCHLYLTERIKGTLFFDIAQRTDDKRIATCLAYSVFFTPAASASLAPWKGKKS